MAWATLAEITEYPGGDQVTTAHLALAQDLVEIFAGVTEDASDQDLVSSRDLRLLNRAVIYEAIFVSDHPEVLTVHDVESASGDGISAQYRTANAQFIAPLADRCINRLSWRQRGLRVRRRGARYDLDDRGNRDSAVRDDDRLWTPL